MLPLQLADQFIVILVAFFLPLRTLANDALPISRISRSKVHPKGAPEVTGGGTTPSWMFRLARVSPKGIH